MLTYRYGAASGRSETGLATYYQSSEHVPEMMAGYYVGAQSIAQAAPRSDLHPVVAEGLGITAGQALTTEELANLLGGRRADGEQITGKQAGKNAYIDLTFSAPKSFSVALIHADQSERAVLEDAYQRAVSSLIEHISSQIGTASIGKTSLNRARKREPAELAVIQIEHYTARPTLPVAVGEETENIKMKVPGDPQRHTHMLFMNASFVPDTGRVTSLYQEGLQQSTKEWGAVGQAMLATELRKLGVNVELDETPGLSFNDRMARLSDVPRWICDVYSKRHGRGEEAAKEYAKAHGYDFDALTPEQKIKVFGGAINEGREAKERGGLNEYESWMQQARDVGYQHRSVLRPGQEQDLRSRAERLEEAYHVGLPMLSGHLERRHVLEGSVPREVAAKSLIATGIADASEVNALTAAYRSEGIMQDGKKTSLHWAPTAGKRYGRISTQLSVEMEQEAIGLLKAAASDKSVALSPEAVERAVQKVSAEQGLDFTSEHGLKQRAFIDKIAAQGRAAVGVGVAGSGKSASLRPLVEAWHDAGRTTYGATLAWRQAAGLKDAGVGQGSRDRSPKRRWEANKDTLTAAGIEGEKTFALAAFLRGMDKGRITPDRDSVVIIDEIALVGTRQLLDLARQQAKHGFQIVGIGDDMQCASVEAGATIDLARRAFGADNVPELLSSTRQLTERDRETAALWREGKAAEALGRKDQDGTLKIVPGGYSDAIRATVDLWEERKRANAGVDGYTLGISVPTNADGRAVGAEILERRRRSGEINHRDLLQLEACDQNGETYTLTIAPGSRVRLFDRVRGQDSTGRSSIAGVNGTVVEVISHNMQGMTVRKTSGLDTTIAWAALRHEDGPIRLSYGDAVTIDSRQSDTVTEHILSMPSGSAMVNGFKAYTAESRHRVAAWLVTSQGAEKQELESRRPLGDARNREADVVIVKAAVIENMAKNLSRQDKKMLATDFIQKSPGLQSGHVDSMLAEWNQRYEEKTAEAKPPTVVLDIIAAETEIVAVTPVIEATANSSNVPVKTTEERVAAVIAAGRWSLDDGVHYLMHDWEARNPVPDKDAWAAAAEQLMVWTPGSRGGHWIWTGPDPLEAWESRRADTEITIEDKLDVLVEQFISSNASDIPTVSQEQRDAARAASISQNVPIAYHEQKRQDYELER